MRQLASFIVILVASTLVGCNEDLKVEPRPVDLCELRKYAEPQDGEKYYTKCYPQNSNASEYYKSLKSHSEKGATVISQEHMANVLKMRNEAEKQLKYCNDKLSLMESKK